MRPFRMLIAAVAVLLAACSPDTMAEKLLDPPARAALDRVSDAITARDVAALRALTAPDAITPDFDQQAATALGLLPPGDPSERKTVGVQKFVMASGDKATSFSVSYQYRFSEGWALVTVIIRQKDGPYQLTGLRVVPVPGDLQAINKFKLAGKSAKFYAVLIAMAAIAALVLGTLVAVIRQRKQLKRPYVWMAVVLVGIGAFSINWTSGQTRFNWESFGLFGASAFAASAYAPWILTFYLPLGAVTFWLLKWQGILKLKESPPPANVPAP